MPGTEELLSATMDHQMNVAEFNVRKFITSAVDGMDLGDYAGVVQELTKVVDDIERETGAPLDADNEKGWDSLRKKVEVGASLPSAQFWCLSLAMCLHVAHDGRYCHILLRSLVLICAPLTALCYTAAAASAMSTRVWDQDDALLYALLLCALLTIVGPVAGHSEAAWAG